MDINKLDTEAKNYFDSLPKNLQEQILQSNIKVQSKQELESIYNNITCKQN